MSCSCPPPPPPSSDYPHYSREPFLRPWARETGRRQISPGPAGRLPVASPEYRTPFQWGPKTVRHQPGTLSDMNRNGVGQKSERCPTEIGISVRQPPEYACHNFRPPLQPRLILLFLFCLIC